MWSSILKYPIRSAIIALIGLVVTIGGWVLVHSLFSSAQTISAGVESTSVWSGSQGLFLFLTILASAIIIGYRLKKGSWPHPAFTAVMLGPTLFNWLWWSLKPETWNEWVHSNTFWPITIALVFVAIMWAQENAAVKLTRFLLVGGVMFAIGLGILGFRKSSSPQNNFSVVPRGSTIGSSSTERFEGNARDQERLNGPDRDYIMSRFADKYPVLTDIAACESNFRQFTDATRKIPLPSYDTVNSSAIGVFQILEKTHGPKAESLGYDLRTLEGNASFAEWLYQNESTTPWETSAWCWREHMLPTSGGSSGGIMSVASIGPLDTIITVPDTTVWTPMVAVGGPSYGLTWRGNNNDISLIIRWSKGGVVHLDTMYVGEENQFLPVTPDWVQVRPLNQEVAMIHLVRKRW